MTLTPARLWRRVPRESLAVGLLGLAALGALAGATVPGAAIPGLSGASAARAATRAPAPPPLLVRELAPRDAFAVNGAIPLDGGPNPAARPFALGKVDAATRARALECLASAVYYEAGSEDVDGQKAVAQVVLNRVRHGAFPASICGVVYEGSTRATGCQFTFTCDGSLMRRPGADGWARARKVAEAALGGAVYAPVGNATHYHANYVVPYWAPSLTKNAVVGTHIFYRWSGGWGRPPAFSQRYARHEPNAAALRIAAVEAAARPGPSEAELIKAEEAEDLAVMEAIFATGAAPKDGKRVAVRFNPAARKAVEEAPRKPYLDKVDASDNLRWTLTGGTPEAAAKPLGRPAPAATAAGAGASSL